MGALHRRGRQTAPGRPRHLVELTRAGATRSPGPGHATTSKAIPRPCSVFRVRSPGVAGWGLRAGPRQECRTPPGQVPDRRAPGAGHVLPRRLPSRRRGRPEMEQSDGAEQTPAPPQQGREGRGDRNDKGTNFGPQESRFRGWPGGGCFVVLAEVTPGALCEETARRVRAASLARSKERASILAEPGPSVSAARAEPCERTGGTTRRREAAGGLVPRARPEGRGRARELPAAWTGERRIQSSALARPGRRTRPGSMRPAFHACGTQAERGSRIVVLAARDFCCPPLESRKSWFRGGDS